MSRQTYFGQAPKPPALGNVRVHWRLMCFESYLRTVDVKYAKRAPSRALPADKEEEVVDFENIELSQSVSGSSPRNDSAALDSTIELSGEQKAVMRIVLEEKQNVFFTGAAGTGKSVLLKALIRELQARHGKGAVAVTALTGIAACNIGGQTLHRWAGVGLGEGTVDVLQKKLTKQSRGAWKYTKVLLVDEVSMLKNELLEKLDTLAQRMRGNSLPFGGIQLVFTGDLFQLPPITRDVGPVFCFETPLWPQLVQRTLKLTRVFRQKDSEFARVLNELRVGEVSPATERLFRSLSRPPKLPKGIVPTQLFATRRQVQAANQNALDRLDGTMYEYVCTDWLSARAQELRVNLSTDCAAVEQVQLRVGCQVMLIKNIDKTLVNGSIGKIVAFVTPEQSMRVPDESAKKEHSMEVQDLLGRFNAKHAASDRKRVLAEDLTVAQAQSATVLPVVKFTLHDNTVRYVIVQPEVWSTTDAFGEVIASRCQIPLMLSWALSIHKAQGQTLPHLSVNLNNIFACGQAYVAISRATRLEGLQIQCFEPRKVMANPVVKRFYAGLASITDEEIAQGERFFAALPPPEQPQRSETRTYEPELATRTQSSERKLQLAETKPVQAPSSGSVPEVSALGASFTAASTPAALASAASTLAVLAPAAPAQRAQLPVRKSRTRGASASIGARARASVVKAVESDAENIKALPAKTGYTVARAAVHQPPAPEQPVTSAARLPLMELPADAAGNVWSQEPIVGDPAYVEAELRPSKRRRIITSQDDVA